MEHLETALHRAWTRVRPGLLADPARLAACVARGRTQTLIRPPRAWCLAVRASDRRIPSPPDARDGRRHAITLTADLCTTICAPVRLPAPGLMLDEAAALLGTTPIGLRNARLDGTLATHHIVHLAGRRGKPVPVVYTDKPLDPCAKRLARPDPAWLWTADYLPSRIPPDLCQSVERIARWCPHVGRHRYDPNRHPELDDTAAPRAPSKRLPPPLPDHVWYKWSRSGHYLGDDPSNWRTGPDDLGERPPRYRRKNTSRRRRRPSSSDGSIHFNGYQWLCPACGRTCRTIYYPLRPLNLLDLVDPAERTTPSPLPRLAQIVEIPFSPLPARERAGVRGNRVESRCAPPPSDLEGRTRENFRQRESGDRVESHRAISPQDAMARSHPGFACHRCHRVRFFTRVRVNDAWNQLIAYLTGGLLYGRDVERPSWFTAARRKPYKPRPGAPPARRRAQVRDLLLRGASRADIAAALHITPQGVTAHAIKIYKSERVRGQRALLRKYNHPLPPRLILRRDRILTALRAGHAAEQIARDLNLRVTSVERYARDLRRLGHLPQRPRQRDQVAALHAAGLDRHAIARALNTTPQSVSTCLCNLRAAGQLPRVRRVRPGQKEMKSTRGRPTG